MDLLSICIPTYNNCERLHGLLCSILYYNRRKAKIIVIDNASDDGTEEMMCEFKNVEEIIYLRNDENLGYDGNQLRVIEEGKKYSLYSLWLGSDDVPYELFYQDIYDILESNRPDLVLLNCFFYPTAHRFRYIGEDYIESDLNSSVSELMLTAFGLIVVNNSLLNVDSAKKYNGTIHVYLGALVDMLIDANEKRGNVNVYIAAKPYIYWGNKTPGPYSEEVRVGYGRIYASLPEKVQEAGKLILQCMATQRFSEYGMSWNTYCSICGHKNNLPQLEDIKISDKFIHQNSRKKIVIFGAGQYGKKTLKFFDGQRDRIIYFVDNNPFLTGSQVYEYMIYPFSKLDEEERDSIFIIVSMQYNKGREDAICQLTEKGWKLGEEFQVYDMFQKQMIYDYLENVSQGAKARIEDL